MKNSKFIFCSLIVSLIFVAACARKQQSLGLNKHQQELEKLSKEIENTPVFSNTHSEKTMEILAEESTQESKIASKAIAQSISKDKPSLASSSFNTEQAKIAKSEMKTQVKKKSVLKLLEKSRSGVNQFIKIGIILLLVGLVISIIPLLGFSFIGGIVALVGLIFLILGLIEYL
jgi:hypothetical protein